MRINLIPPEARPTRSSPTPYMPLLGLLAISVIWIITQFATASVVQREYEKHRQEHIQLRQELGEYRELPGRLGQAESEQDSMYEKAAAITAITQSGGVFTPVLKSIAESLPENIRLTSISLDYSTRSGQILGYGDEERTDLEVASFLRALNTDEGFRQMLRSAELEYCHNAELDGYPVKQFSIILRFREPPLAELIEEGLIPEEEDDGT